MSRFLRAGEIRKISGKAAGGYGIAGLRKRGVMELLSLSAVQLGTAIREGRTTAVEAMEAVLGEIEKKESIYNCYITVDKEKALRKAEETQNRIEAGELSGPLAGVPMAVKDNLCTKGMLTTCASRMLSGFVPGYSADVVLGLERAGAVMIGKTNMDEFAMGSTTETSVYGPVRNPHNTAYVPGGSSGGSAAAVAAQECFFALGSDTGGSVRQPAAHCGVVGMKPTYGMVSRYGLVAYASSMDQVGPLCKNVEDCAAVLGVIAGYAPSADSTYIQRKGNVDGSDQGTSKERDISLGAALKKDVKGLRIGLPRDYFGEGLDGEVRDALMKAANSLKTEGAAVEEFELGLAEYALPAYYTIAAAEASSNLERFDGIKYGYRTADADNLHRMYKKTRSEGFGTEVKRRIMLGGFVLSSGYYDAYYLKALQAKALIKKAFDQAFSEYDCILGPVAPGVAPKLGESLKDPMKMYLGDVYTVSANLAGLPAISLPCGKGREGLPIGMQLIGDCFQERKLLRIAYTYEQCRY